MQLTVGEYLRQLAPELARRKTAPYWPPDAFGLAAAVLHRSGAYTAVVDRWPPTGIDPDNWAEQMERIAANWRERSGDGQSAPRDVQRWWAVVHAAKDLKLTSVVTDRKLTEALLQIVAAADEACFGIGVPSINEPDLFEFQVLASFGDKDVRTLCSDIDESRLVVLPKIHTPQSGMTIRSLSHHLALYMPGEVTPRWWFQPTSMLYREWCFNVLLLPWPRKVLPRHFKVAQTDELKMADGFGFFACDVRADSEFDVRTVVETFEAARDQLRERYGEDACSIDGIIFPELSLKPEEPLAIAQQTGAFVIGGVGQALANGMSRNYAVVVIPPATAEWPQSKHHRWKLTASQIEQYGLGSRLDPTMNWWENMTLEKRELNFFALNEWLTFSVFICEDLARIDPVSDLIRSVGPNVVVALLLDGPQLASRWPARYATVLADDPGCSVLTLTSLGMAHSSVPEGKNPSAVVALWKDARGAEAREIKLEDGSVGVVLSLRREFVDEYAADGRSDYRTTASVRLNHIFQVKPAVAAKKVAKGQKTVKTRSSPSRKPPVVEAAGVLDRFTVRSDSA